MNRSVSRMGGATVPCKERWSKFYASVLQCLAIKWSGHQHVDFPYQILPSNVPSMMHLLFIQLIMGKPLSTETRSLINV